MTERLDNSRVQIITHTPMEVKRDRVDIGKATGLHQVEERLRRIGVLYNQDREFGLEEKERLCAFRETVEVSGVLKVGREGMRRLKKAEPSICRNRHWCREGHGGCC